MQQQHVPFVKKPSGKRKYPVEVRSAGHMGDGVFATRNIKRGEVCCFYDGIVLRDGFVLSSTDAGAVVSNVFGYNQHVVNDLNLAGFNNEIRPGGCAQLCNDASTEYEDGDFKYLKSINVKSDLLDDGSMVFVAKKPIKKDEQLFYTYGKQYWDRKKERESDGTCYNPKDYFKMTLEEMEWDSAFIAEIMEQYPEGNDLEDFIQRWKLLRKVEEREKEEYEMDELVELLSKMKIEWG